MLQVGKILFFFFSPLWKTEVLKHLNYVCVCVCLFKSSLYGVSKTRIHSASWDQAGKINLQSGFDIK